jgi:hypothetical protein
MVHELALADKQGGATFYRVKGRPARSGLRRQRLPDPQETVEEISVKTDTLDNIIPKSTPIDFVKIDVEGAELNVLRGALELIKRDRPKIVFEFQPAFAEKFGYVSEDLFDFLANEADLKVTLMDTWLGDEKSGLSKQEFLESVDSHHEFYFMAY